MTSPAYPIEKSKSKGSALTLNKRILFVILVCCIQMIYVPTSNRVTGGIEPKLSIDVFPVWPIWVLPYVSCYFLWLSSMAWVILKAEDRLFRALHCSLYPHIYHWNINFYFLPNVYKGNHIGRQRYLYVPPAHYSRKLGEV